MSTAHKEASGGSIPLSMIVGLLSLLFYVPVSLSRFIEGDEGFYVIAARLVAEGALPYLDFFYPQMPLLPMLHAIPVSLGESSWEVLRLFHAVFAGATVAFVAWRFLDERLRVLAILSAFGVMLCDNSFAWVSAVKTLGPVAFFLTGAVVLVDRGRTTASLVVAGAFLGMGVGVRLLVAGVIPLLVIHLWRRDRALVRPFLVGLFWGLLPSILFLLLNPELFYFNNISNHFFRGQKPASENLAHKLHILRCLFGLADPVRESGVQVPILMIISSLALCTSLVMRRLPSIYVVVGLGFVAINFVPSPMYLQYFSSAIPLLVIGVGEWLQRLWSRSTGGWRIVSLVVLCGILLRYFSVAPGEVYRHTVTGRRVLGVERPERAQHLTLEAMDRIARAVDRYTSPGGLVVLFWPGYLLSSHAVPYPRFENQFAIRRAMTPHGRKSERYLLPTDTYVRRAIVDPRTEAIVLSPGSMSAKYRRAVSEAGYQKVEELHLVSIWRR